jgi:hypothetical protein
LKTIKTIAVTVGVATFFGLAQVGALAAESQKASERPERPNKPATGSSSERPSLNQVKDAVKSFQEQKKEFIKQQAEAAKAVGDVARDTVRETKKEVGTQVRLEVKDSLKEAKDRALEQARKLKEEAANAAKENRGKN